jgi:hypothetical protein
MAVAAADKGPPVAGGKEAAAAVEVVLGFHNTEAPA